MTDAVHPSDDAPHIPVLMRPLDCGGFTCFGPVAGRHLWGGWLYARIAEGGR